MSLSIETEQSNRPTKFADLAKYRGAGVSIPRDLDLAAKRFTLVNPGISGYHSGVVSVGGIKTGLFDGTTEGCWDRPWWTEGAGEGMQKGERGETAREREKRLRPYN